MLSGKSRRHGEQDLSTAADRRLEMYSSAYTLSDMEIFVFPELLYALVLANVLSERLWAWREEPWFSGIEDLPPRQRVQRVKQYIMDHYAFNLDLDTWGLTDKQRELDRFAPFIDVERLKQSNALFGYEGDKYYFSLDIRRHFGLDRYHGDVIPYWKTETLEAMDAFRYRPGWQNGGGECVSLSTLYAAALFVVARIPLRHIYLLATPLHSQNFVDIDDGFLTNNRRIVTRTMWFNGSELSGKARRALENEQVTIVAHLGRYVHSLYGQASMEQEAFRHFEERLSSYLTTDFTPEVFGNFIRCHPRYQTCFAYRRSQNNRDWYIESEKALRYEAHSKLRVSDRSRRKLLQQIDLDEFYAERLPQRLVVNDIEAFIRDNRIDLEQPAQREQLLGQFCGDCQATCNIMEALARFIHVRPRLPVLEEKQPVAAPLLDPPLALDRTSLLQWLEERRAGSLTADLALYALRSPQLWSAPFWKAALERNPVSIQGWGDLEAEDLYRVLAELPDQSIYPGERLALPDEVYNFGRGDGFEKAITMLNVLQMGTQRPHLEQAGQEWIVRVGGRRFAFTSGKQLPCDFLPEAAAQPLFS